ncbi:ABC transporter ATP-binding protein [Caldalkalibacillus mannanilyticus]|uniref:ABC transporter ATP-binding protein n=1 Tax=Caldalkalibacillus mannanilyticus TaxID=1418 RepID=UPI00046821FF|nr:ABC transporter ATP-binding protein [Caldalkalibacillus mannanilyticus]
MRVGKRLFNYALLYKKSILLALLMLTIAVMAELTGPFIAKKMIDNHILGIEFKWYETELTDKKAVSFQGTWYKRDDHFLENESRGEEVRILQVGRKYYFIDQAIAFDGERIAEKGKLIIQKGDERKEYTARELTAEELYQFYKPEIPGLVTLLGIYFFLLVFASFFQYGKSYLLQTSANQIIQKMRMDVFGQTQRLPIQYFDNLPAGKVVSRVTNDTEAVRELYVTVLATFFTSSIYMIGIFTALFLLDAKLAAICLLVIPIIVVWIILYRKFASKYNHVIRSRLSDINGMINESIQGMPIIHAFRRSNQTMEEFEKFNKEHFAYQNKLLNLNSLTGHNLVHVLRNLAFVALIWYFGGASLGVGSVVSMGVLYAFVDYLNRLFHPVVDVVNKLAQLEQALVASERVFQLMNEKGVDVQEGEIPRFKGDVVFDQVTFGYKKDENVLKNISFEANQGETVALVGHTGSGKSSIMNLLLRFYEINQGNIYIDGMNIKEMPVQHLRKHMGIVLQDPFLFTGTIASNVSLDDPTITREMVEKALKDVGAEEFVSLLPQGYDEPVIEKGSTLSSGQRQLISFARALAFNPAILILDEATANIDTETESVIQNALEILKKGRTTFVIAHRLSTIKNADQILVLHKGEIVESGNHDTLMRLNGRYHQMYQLQQGHKESTAV